MGAPLAHALLQVHNIIPEGLPLEEMAGLRQFFQVVPHGQLAHLYMAQKHFTFDVPTSGWGRRVGVVTSKRLVHKGLPPTGTTICC